MAHSAATTVSLVEAPTRAARELRMSAVDGEGNARDASSVVSLVSLGDRAAQLTAHFEALESAARSVVERENKAAETGAHAVALQAQGATGGGVSGNALPTAGSDTAVLEQALQANDDALLECVLRTTDEKVRFLLLLCLNSQAHRPFDDILHAPL